MTSYPDEALACLKDLEQALRLGNYNAVVHGVFIWSQRHMAIMAGEEDWKDQRFDPAHNWIAHG